MSVLELGWEGSGLMGAGVWVDGDAWTWEAPGSWLTLLHLLPCVPIAVLPQAAVCSEPVSVLSLWGFLFLSLSFPLAVSWVAGLVLPCLLSRLHLSCVVSIPFTFLFLFCFSP